MMNQNKSSRNYTVGYRGINQSTPEEVIIYSFEPNSSIGRVCSQIVKHMINNEKVNPKRAYLIEDPSSLTFSSSIEFLIEKYKLKFNAGGKSKGPYYKKSVLGLFKLILRTMMKYKAKHKNLYKKICVLEGPHTREGTKIKVSVRSHKYTRTTSISQLISML